MSVLTSTDLNELRSSALCGATCTATGCTTERHVRTILRLSQASPVLIRPGKSVPAHLSDCDRMLAAVLDVQFRHKGSPGPSSVRNSYMLTLQHYLTKAVGAVSQLVHQTQAGVFTTTSEITEAAKLAATAAGAVATLRKQPLHSDPFGAYRPAPTGDLGLRVLLLLGHAAGALAQHVNDGVDRIRTPDGKVQSWDSFTEECCIEASLCLMHWRKALAAAEG